SRSESRYETVGPALRAVWHRLSVRAHDAELPRAVATAAANRQEGECAARRRHALLIPCGDRATCRRTRCAAVRCAPRCRAPRARLALDVPAVSQPQARIDAATANPRRSPRLSPTDAKLERPPLLLVARRARCCCGRPASAPFRSSPIGPVPPGRS